MLIFLMIIATIVCIVITAIAIYATICEDLWILLLAVPFPWILDILMWILVLGK